MEREARSQMRARRAEDDERKLGAVMDQVDMFMRILPQLLQEKASHLDLPPAYKVRKPQADFKKKKN